MFINNRTIPFKTCSMYFILQCIQRQIYVSYVRRTMQNQDECFLLNSPAIIQNLSPTIQLELGNEV